jgi:hypothetical protein
MHMWLQQTRAEEGLSYGSDSARNLTFIDQHHEAWWLLRCASSYELEESSLNNKNKNLVQSTTVQNVLKNLNLLPDNDNASTISPIVALASVSGGCDSVALLHAVLCRDNAEAWYSDTALIHFYLPSRGARKRS